MCVYVRPCICLSVSDIYIYVHACLFLPICIDKEHMNLHAVRACTQLYLYTYFYLVYLMYMKTAQRYWQADCTILQRCNSKYIY